MDNKNKERSEEIEEKIRALFRESAIAAQHSQKAFWLPISITLLVILVIGAIAYLIAKLAS